MANDGDTLRTGLKNIARDLDTPCYLDRMGVIRERPARIRVAFEDRFLVSDAGKNQHVGPTGHPGSVVHRNYRRCTIGRVIDGHQRDNVVGLPCATIDTPGREIKLGRLHAGALIEIHCSGPYGLTISPVYFISPPPPQEAVEEDGADGHSVVTECVHFVAATVNAREQKDS